MRNDRLEKKLSERLGDYQEIAPEGLFERIETTLAEQGAVAPVRRYRTLWRAATVAALIALYIAISPLLNTDEQQAEQTLITQNDTSIKVEQPTLPESSAQEAEGGIATRIKQAILKDASPEVIATLPTQTSREVEFTADSSEAGRVIAVTHNTEQQDHQELMAEGRAQQHKEQPEEQDKEQQDDRAPYYTSPRDGFMAEQSPRRGRRLMASLYAGNVGGAGIERAAGGATTIQNSDVSLMSLGPNTFQVRGDEPDEYLKTSYNNDISTPHLRHRAPLSLGVQIGYPLGGRFSLISGVNYNYLHSEAEGVGELNRFKLDRRLHYLGLPIALGYNIIDRPLFKLYARAGGAFNVCISGTDQYSVDKLPSTPSRVGARGIETSVDAAVGAIYMASPRLGIYLEPGISHHFAHKHQPTSYWTENPTNFSANVGVRFMFE